MLVINKKIDISANIYREKIALDPVTSQKSEGGPFYLNIVVVLKKFDSQEKEQKCFTESMLLIFLNCNIKTCRKSKAEGCTTILINVV